MGEVVCSESDFRTLLCSAAQEVLRIRRDLKNEAPSIGLSRRRLSALSSEALELENVLDDYGARNNATFVTLGEIVASLRGFCAIGHTLRYMQARLARRGYLEDGDEEVDYFAETSRTLSWVEASISLLLDACHAEIESICGPVRVEDPHPFPEAAEAQKLRLPHTVGAENLVNVDAHIVAIVSQFQANMETLRARYDCRRFDDVEEMRRFVLDVCDEEQCRFFETKLHTLQSRYDTFIKNTVVEKNDPELARLRHFVSTGVHLLQVMTQLVHFYERHEDDIRSEKAKQAIASLIDKEQVLDRLLNYGLYYVYRFMAAGIPATQRLIERYTQSSSIEFRLPDGTMLHVRPLTLISKIVQHHGTPVQIEMGGESCYAGSVMQMLLMVGAQPTERCVRFNGDRRPLEHIEVFFRLGLLEDPGTPIPDSLSYLRR